MQSQVLSDELVRILAGGASRPLDLKSLQQTFLLAIAYVDEAATVAGVRTFFIGYEDDEPKYLDNFQYADAVSGSTASLEHFPQYLALLLDNGGMISSEAAYGDEDEDGDGDEDDEVVKYISECSVWVEDDVSAALEDPSIRQALVASAEATDVPRTEFVEELITFISRALA